VKPTKQAGFQPYRLATPAERTNEDGLERSTAHLSRLKKGKKKGKKSKIQLYLM
jgi:hypothetical protein